MYPSIEELEKRKLELSRMENVLLEEQFGLKSKIQTIQDELEGITKIIKVLENEQKDSRDN